MKKLNQNGFGFIVIVLAILLIIAIGGVLYLVLNSNKNDTAEVTTSNTSESGEDATANSELSQVHLKLESYFNENSVYPSTLEDPALGLSTEKITDGAGTKYQYETAGCDTSGCRSYTLRHKLSDPNGPYNDGNGYIIKKSLN